MKSFALPAILSFALVGCASNGAYHDSIKLQTAGINFNASTGVSAGYLAATVDRSQNVDKNGAAITVPGCNGVGHDSPDTYSNLNSKATANASSVTPVIAAPTGGTVPAPGVQSPSIAWASGDTSANGQAALIASAATTAHPADTLAALCNVSVLPTAPAGSVVRDGIAPK